MRKCIDKLMCYSKLAYKGSLCELRGHLNHKRRVNNDDVNFVVIPKADGYDHGNVHFKTQHNCNNNNVFN